MQKSVIEYLRKTVAAYPDKVSVRDAEMEVTFSGLWDAARSVSNAVKAAGVDRNSPIGVYLPKGCKMVESFAGINMCGCFYVPLDIKSPDARVSSILSTLEAACVVTDQAHADHLRSFFSGIVLVIEEVMAHVNPEGGDGNDALQIDIGPRSAVGIVKSRGVLGKGCRSKR